MYIFLFGIWTNKNASGYIIFLEVLLTVYFLTIIICWYFAIRMLPGILANILFPEAYLLGFEHIKMLPGIVYTWTFHNKYKFN